MKIYKIIVTLAVICLSLNVSAEGLSGHCGSNLDWELDTKGGELIISGTGNMTEYKQYFLVPWTINRGSIQQVSMKEGVTSISQNAFYGCTNLENAILPEGITKVGIQAFYGCTALKEITMPSTVTKVCKSAFYGCTALETITIPASVKKFEKNAFYGCTGVKVIDCYMDAPVSIDSTVFFGIPDKCKLIVNPGTKKQWKSSSFWSRFEIVERGE